MTVLLIFCQDFEFVEIEKMGNCFGKIIVEGSGCEACFGVNQIGLK